MGIIEKSSNLNPFEAIGKIVDIIQSQTEYGLVNIKIFPVD